MPYKKGGKNIAAVIDDAILAGLTKTIQVSVDRLASTLSDDTISWADKEFFLQKEQAEICSSLLVIKNLNNGSLPTKQLSNLWESHCCVQRI